MGGKRLKPQVSTLCVMSEPEADWCLKETGATQVGVSTQQKPAPSPSPSPQISLN